MIFKKRIPVLIAAIMMGIGLASCTRSQPPVQQISFNNIPVSRTFQRREIDIAQSDFIFRTAVDVMIKMGFTIQDKDREALTIRALKTHNDNRIVFDIVVHDKGRYTYIDMATSYYDVPAYDYREPYTVFSAMMWDYTGSPLTER